MTVKNREKTYFKKGCKPGPGRPRKEQCFADITRQMLDAKKIDIRLTLPSGKVTEIGLQASPTIRHGIVASMIREAFKGNTTAAQQLMDRTDGKVTDKLQASVEHNGGIETLVHLYLPRIRQSDTQKDKAP